MKLSIFNIRISINIRASIFIVIFSSFIVVFSGLVSSTAFAEPEKISLKKQTQDDLQISSKKQIHDDLLIFSAASLTDAITTLNQEFAKSYPNIKTRVNFSSSGALRRQIEVGVMPDFYISANVKQIDLLIQKSIVKKTSTYNYVSNGLALIAPKDSKKKIKNIADLVKINGRISLGTPGVVPVGTYAKASMDNVKTNNGITLFKHLEKQFVFADTVRQVVRYAQTGNVESGFVYTSDAALFKDKIRLFCIVDPSLHGPIKYGVVFPESKIRRASNLYFSFIFSDKGLKILSDFGFVTTHLESKKTRE